MALTLATQGAKFNPRPLARGWHDYSFYLYGLGDGSGGNVSGTFLFPGLDMNDVLYHDWSQMWQDASATQKAGIWLLGSEWEAVQGCGKIYLTLAAAVLSTEDASADAWASYNAQGTAQFPTHTGLYLGRPTVLTPTYNVVMGANTLNKIYRVNAHFLVFRPPRS